MAWNRKQYLVFPCDFQYNEKENKLLEKICAWTIEFCDAIGLKTFTF